MMVEINGERCGPIQRAYWAGHHDPVGRRLLGVMFIIVLRSPYALRAISFPESVASAESSRPRTRQPGSQICFQRHGFCGAPTNLRVIKASRFSVNMWKVF